MTQLATPSAVPIKYHDQGRSLEMAAKKTAVKKTVSKKAGTKGTKKGVKRAPKPKVKMTNDVQALVAKVLGNATEAALADENLGVTDTRSKELPGRRTGSSTQIRLDDGRRITVVVTLTAGKPRKPR